MEWLETGDAVSQQEKVLDPITDRLQRSRGRARASLLLRAVLLSVALAGGVYLVLSVAQVWLPLRLTAWLWSALVFITVVLFSVLWALAHTPSLLYLARLADRRFALQERISTTLELSGFSKKGIEGEIASALFSDTAHHVEQIEPDKLVPFRLPREAWFALVLLVMIVATQVWLPERQLEQAHSTGQLSEPLDGDGRSEAAANLRRVSELMSREAEERENAYLQALAQAFNELGERVEAGELDRSAFEAELSQLMEHVERVYEGEASPLADMLAPPPTPASGAPALPDEAIGEKSLSGEAPSEASSGIGSETSTSLEKLLGDLADIEVALQQDNAERGANAGRISRSDLPEFDPYDPYVTPEVLDFLKRQQELRAAQPVGTAQEADKSPGDLAGEGVQPLTEEGAEAAFEEVSAELDEVLLPEGQGATEDYIQLELPPEAQLSEVADDQAPTRRNWQAGQEAELRRDLLGPRDRAVVSRYFGRREPEAQATP